MWPCSLATNGNTMFVGHNPISKQPTALAPLLNKKLRRALKPVFKTHVRERFSKSKAARVRSSSALTRERSKRVENPPRGVKWSWNSSRGNGGSFKLAGTAMDGQITMKGRGSDQSIQNAYALPPLRPGAFNL